MPHHLAPFVHFENATSQAILATPAQETRHGGRPNGCERGCRQNAAYLDRKRKSSCISSRMPLTSIFALPAQNKHRLSKSQRSDCRRNLPIPAHESWHCVRYDNKYMGIDIQYVQTHEKLSTYPAHRHILSTCPTVPPGRENWFGDVPPFCRKPHHPGGEAR